MKLRNYKIDIPDNKGHFHYDEIEDFEYKNPTEYVMSAFITSSILFDKRILDTKGYEVSNELINDFLLEKAVKDWQKKYEKIKTTPIPKNLVQLLDAKSKKEQKRLLKGLSLTNAEFISFIIMAYEKFGYTYSQYKAKHHHKGLDETQLPNLINIEENGKITTIGETTLTEGQLKQVVENRNVTVSKFLDNKENWHCFFFTFKSLGGKENHKNGQPHLHYISDKWCLSREYVLNQLSCKDYQLPSLPHIDFHTHRNPRKKTNANKQLLSLGLMMQIRKNITNLVSV